MAIEKNIRINVDTKQAVKDTDNLTQSLKEVDGQAEKTGTGLKDVGENGGAIAILDSLTDGLATRLRDSYEATKLFNFSLKGTKTALIATGVGAFVVSLGLVVAYWDEITDFITGANKELKDQLSLQEEITSEQELQLSILDASDETLKRQGKTEEEIKKLKLAQLNLLIDTQRKELEIEKQRLEQLNTIKKEGGSSLESFGRSYGKFFTTIYGFIDGLFAKININLGLAEKSKGFQDFIFEGIFGTDEDIAETETKINELDLKITGLINRRDGILNSLDTPKEEERTKETPFELENGLTPGDNRILGSKELLNEKLSELDKKYIDEVTARNKAFENERIAEDIREEDRKKILSAAIIQLAGQTAGLIGAIAKEGSDLAKGAAVAQATISGFQGAQNAFTTAALSPVTTFFPAYPFVQAGLAGAFSAVQIGKILSTKPIETSAPSSGGGGRPSTPAAPSFNLVQGSATNQIANSVNTGTQPVRSFVVSSDITSNQELDRRIEEGSTL